MSRREALTKAAAGAAVAGAAWSAPAVKGLTVVPDYAAAGTATGLTRTFRILGVSRTGNGNWGDIGGNSNQGSFDFRGLQVPGPTPGETVNASGGTSGGVPGYNPGTAQVLESSQNPTGHAASLVTMTATLGAAGTVTATMQNNENAFFRADAGTAVNPNNPDYYNDDDRIRIPVTFNVDPPFNQCRVTSGALYHAPNNAANTEAWDLGGRFYPYPNPVPLNYSNNPTIPSSITVTPATLTAPPPAPDAQDGSPFMTIEPATSPNTSGSFTQVITVENRDSATDTNNIQRIFEIRFIVTS